MRQSFKLIPADGKPITVTADSRDALVWEKTNKRGRDVSDLGRGATMADQYDLAWHAAKRAGELEGVDRKTFDAEYVVEGVGEAEDEDPTSPVP